MQHEPLTLKTPRKGWVAAEFRQLVEEWHRWRDEVAKIVDHPYDRNTCSEVYADGEENMSKHAVLQAKTLTFLDSNLSGHGFIYGRDGRHIDRTDLRLKIRVKHRIQDLEELRASLPYAVSWWRAVGTKAVNGPLEALSWVVGWVLKIAALLKGGG